MFRKPPDKTKLYVYMYKSRNLGNLPGFRHPLIHAVRLNDVNLAVCMYIHCDFVCIPKPSYFTWIFALIHTEIGSPNRVREKC